MWQTEIGNYGSFFVLLPPPLKTWKIRILKKYKKILEISSFYTCVWKTTIIWHTVPELWSETDWSFCHFRPFCCPFNTLTTQKIKILKKWKNNQMMHGLRDIECNRVFCHFGPFFPFYPTNNLKNQNLEKMKKTPGNILILYLCTTMTTIRCMVPEIWSANGRLTSHFGQFFAHLPPLNNLENKILKIWKNA